ncbi:hypothetical protein L6164_019562 [Bauhinia variegata]|uniref:Uncharacterized protein n=1 Tax=Bauhinia variegata TaxID=167791 RepID=A0ACB9MSH0_BAUVA|nr:hypothetical protein L6164_019562 [Bauhinia variegata]
MNTSIRIESFIAKVKRGWIEDSSRDNYDLDTCIESEITGMTPVIYNARLCVLSAALRIILYQLNGPVTRCDARNSEGSLEKAYQGVV